MSKETQKVLFCILGRTIAPAPGPVAFICVLCLIFLAKVVDLRLRMNQRHPQSRHTPHVGSVKL